MRGDSCASLYPALAPDWKSCPALPISPDEIHVGGGCIVYRLEIHSSLPSITKRENRLFEMRVIRGLVRLDPEQFHVGLCMC